jgi:exodeoxyribonuclease V beta subunit
VLFHDPGSGRRVLDLRRDDPVDKDRAASEQRDDGSRALYVALTRAKHATFVWWSHESYSKGGALTRLLFARDPDTGAIDPAQFDASAAPVPEPEEAVAQLALLVARAPEGIAVEVVGETEPARGVGVDPSYVAASPVGDAARLARTLDRRRRRWSYTGITAHHAVPRGPGVETPRGGDDEGPIESGADPFAVHAPDPAAFPPAKVVSRLATLPAGAAFGTLVHGVLERIDFTADDLSAQLSAEIARELASRRLDLTPEVLGGPQDTPGFDLLRDGLVDVIASPLGELFDHATLGAFGRGARLNELDFELHLGASGSSTTDAALGRTVLDHLATDDPFRPWAEQLAGGVFGVDLAGSLNGSIDLVARVGDVDHPRFVIVDYKTNRLHAAGTIPTDGDYAMPSMVDAMVEHHYPLQALLYSVALHRFLRWRLSDYRPADHLGGAAYLFVRGMAGPDTSGRGVEPDGVCRWVIPPDLVEALSDQLAGA